MKQEITISSGIKRAVAARKVNALMLSGLLVGQSLLAASHKPSLAEDPTQMGKANDGESLENAPWRGRSPEELRAWARENLHHKLIGRRVIDAKQHPEWAWFRKSGLGLFLHWGPASLPPGNGDAWAMMWSEGRAKNNLLALPEDMFAAAEEWNPANYDPGKWMEAAARAGFGYAVLTSRHHDGYCLWPTEHGDWDTGEHMNRRDLVKDYLDACRKHGIHTGLYYSGPNWHFDYKNRDFSHPPQGYDYRHKKIDGFTQAKDIDVRSNEESALQVRDLLTRYGPIDMIWWDGNTIMPENEVQKLQPGIFVARGNIATPEGKHQGKSRNVKVSNEAGWWWELCQKTENDETPYWHYNPGLEENHWDANRFLSELVRCRALGGNLLANVTPRPDGTMMDWFYQVCNEMAGWMAHSREAVYDVDLDPPLPMLDKTDNAVTVRGNTWYAMPDERHRIELREIFRPASVALLRTGDPLEHDFHDGTLSLTIPESLRTNLPDMVKIDFKTPPESHY